MTIFLALRTLRTYTVFAAVVVGLFTIFAFQNCAQNLGIDLSKAIHSYSVGGDLHVKEGQTAHLAIPLTDSFPAGTVIHWSLGKGPIGNNEDWDKRKGDYIFPADGRTMMLPALPLVDGVFEGSEPVILSLSTDDGFDFPNATIVIEDSDQPSTLLSSQVEVTGGRVAKIPVAVDVAPLQDITVHWTTKDGTAQAGTDYTAASGTVVIPAGTTQVFVNVQTTLQTVAQPQRNFLVDLTGNGLVSAQPATVTVIIDPTNPADLPPVVTVAPLQATTDEGQPVTFRVSLNHAWPTAVTFNWSVAGGTAKLGEALNPQSGSASVPAGQTYVDVPVATLNDPYYDAFLGNLQFTFNLAGIQQASNKTAQAVGVLHDPKSIQLTISGDKASYGPGDLAVVTLQLNMPVDGTVHLHFQTSDGTGIAGINYIATSGDLVYNRGETAKTFNVQWMNYTGGTKTLNVLSSFTLSSP